jgi:hypothetical protein
MSEVVTVYLAANAVLGWVVACWVWGRSIGTAIANRVGL